MCQIRGLIPSPGRRIPARRPLPPSILPLLPIPTVLPILLSSIFSSAPGHSGRFYSVFSSFSLTRLRPRPSFEPAAPWRLELARYIAVHLGQQILILFADALLGRQLLLSRRLRSRRHPRRFLPVMALDRLRPPRCRLPARIPAPNPPPAASSPAAQPSPPVRGWL